MRGNGFLPLIDKKTARNKDRTVNKWWAVQDLNL